MCSKIWWHRYVHLVTALTAAPCVLSSLTPRRMATQCENTAKTIRLVGVQGFEDRKNDVLFCRQQNNDRPESRVIYFGGDSQDYPESMASHRDNYRYLQWNLVNTAELLNIKFSKSDIFVVRPSRIELKTFSCYDNFIVTKNLGAPKHVPNNNAVVHLRSLLTNAIKRSEEETGGTGGSQNASGVPGGVESIPIILIGFSKGCVVLNQILYELSLITSEPDVKTFIDNITDMYWLDGGHPGGANTWVTKHDILKRLSTLDINIHVFVTPYQINDERRPWLHKEEMIFSNTLNRLNAKVERKILFEDQPGDIMLHFQVLNDFTTGL